jgi:two-component system KDP operon response regulator KdpE
MRALLRATLSTHGMRVVDAETGAQGIALAVAHDPDLVLLDLGLPDIDGIEVTIRLRERSTVPILILSAHGEQARKVLALDAGANDYLTKPFGTGELLARMRVWLRKADPAERGSPEAPATLEAGELRIDFDRRLVFVAGEEVHLTPTQYKLFGMLMRNVGKTLTHEQILQAVWGPSLAKERPHLRVYMAQLRKKLEKDPARPRFLVTEPGIGYRLRP